MSDYIPVFPGGIPLSFTAGSAVSGGQPVEITGDYEVGPCAADSTKYVGIAGHDAPAGEKVTVHTPGTGVQEVAVSAAVTAGQHVKASTTQRVAPFVDGTDTQLRRLGLCIQGQATVDSTCHFLTA